MSNNLVKESMVVKSEADLLLKKSELLKVLSKYEKVFIRGSYELDLMIDGDIDIYVVNNKLDKRIAIKALNRLIEKNDFRGYMFYDFVKRRRKGFPRGYYLGAKTRFRNKKWKIDIWFMNEMDKGSDRFMKKTLQGLDEEKRKTILQLKKIIKDKKTDLPSYVIYDAVIDGGVANIKQLLLYANKVGYNF